MCMQVDMHALAVLSNAPTHFIQSLLIKIFCMMPSGFCLFMESIARFTSIWVSWFNDISFLNIIDKAGSSSSAKERFASMIFFYAHEDKSLILLAKSS